ncbi:MAG: hypothetical protein P1U41_00355 [Vicingaceae bacterium]|nr:hypothetical protein [Vicingaceae bacterium]
MNITYLKHKDIDIKLWDACVSNSVNQLIYAESWYLNLVCPEGWDALILEDYQAVMPLPLKSKVGLSYIQQPIWTQQLGIFSIATITEELVFKFVKSVPKKFKFISSNLNYNNACNSLPLIAKTNLILGLNSSYDTIKSSYSSNTKRNINKASKNNIELDFDFQNISDFIAFIESTLETPLPDNDLAILKQIITQSLKGEKGFIITASQNNEITAACFILKSENRLIYRVARSNKEGKESKAMFLIVDELIRKHSNTNYVLDFEGSEIKGIARFYESFGAEKQPYYYLKKYNLI